jgi:hypothetical protein
MKPRVAGTAVALVLALAGTAAAGCTSQTTVAPTTTGSQPSTSTAPTSTTTSSTTTTTVVPPTTASSVTTATTAAVVECTAKQLSISSLPVQGSAGTVILPIVFVNSGTALCGLQGYPGVSAVVANGVQLGPAASRGGRPPGPLISLEPGQTTQAIVTFINPTSNCAHPASALGLRVYPPNQTSALFLATGAVALCPAPAANDLLIYPIGIGSGQ